MKLRNKWWYDKTECHSNKDNQDTAHNELSLSNVAGIFYILIGGLLVAVFVAIVEFCFRCKSTDGTIKTNGGVILGGGGPTIGGGGTLMTNLPMQGTQGSLMSSCSAVGGGGGNVGIGGTLISSGNLGVGGGGGGGGSLVTAVTGQQVVSTGPVSIGGSGGGGGGVGNTLNTGTLGTHQRNILSDAMHAKAQLTIQAGREYDNGRVGVSVQLNLVEIST